MAERTDAEIKGAGNTSRDKLWMESHSGGYYSDEWERICQVDSSVPLYFVQRSGRDDLASLLTGSKPHL